MTAKTLRQLAAATLLATSIVAQSNPAAETILPPLPSWNGKSRSLIVAKGDAWITPAEQSNFKTTPTYEETRAWLRRLDQASPDIQVTSIGKSPEGRDLLLVVASRDHSFSPESFRRGGKPIVFAQAGIHAGEIDGKDAGLMLLRDMTVRGTKRQLLDLAHFVFVPIFNVDGHERSSPFNRPNQRGPENMGWRTTSKNLNLNRDYAKADSPEMQAMIRTLRAWNPDLYLDLHVTDGADYQYDVTFGFTAPGLHSPAISKWLDETYTPAVTKDLTAAGHIPGPLVFAVADNWVDLSQGLAGWISEPRFSTGYGDLAHIPTILVENHSLKPYEQRVLGTYVLLESTLGTTAARKEALRSAIASDRNARPSTVGLVWEADPNAPPRMVDLLGSETVRQLSPITGQYLVQFTGKPETFRLPLQWGARPSVAVKRSTAYWIHPAWSEVIDRLALHGIRMERITSPRTIEVDMYRITDVTYVTPPFEGHVRVKAKTVTERRRETYPAGSVRISTDQPLGDLAAVLLEPESTDSYFHWGFFNEILSQTEYIEPYVLEPMARRMLEADPKLAEEFRKRLESDAAFRGSAEARLRFFYSRTPFVDARWNLYPVGRE